MNKAHSTDNKYNPTALKEGLEREKLVFEHTEKKETDRKNNPNMYTQQYIKKRLPPPLKKDQNKDVTQKPKHFGRKEDLTPKQEAQTKNTNAPGKNKLVDRTKEISPLPSSNDYHTVSISQRNKMAKGEPSQILNKKQERDRCMRKKKYSQYERITTEPNQMQRFRNDYLLRQKELLKKQASPSEEKA